MNSITAECVEEPDIGIVYGLEQSTAFFMVGCNSCRKLPCSDKDLEKNYILCRSCTRIFCNRCCENYKFDSAYHRNTHNINFKTDTNRKPICTGCVWRSGNLVDSVQNVKKNYAKFKADYISSNLCVTNHIAEYYVKQFYI